MINLRLRTPSGATTVRLAADATLSDLVSTVAGTTGMTSLDIRAGFPPQPLSSSDPSVRLDALGIKTGDSLQISSSPTTPAPAARVAPRAPHKHPSRQHPAGETPSRTEQRRKADAVQTEGGWLMLRVVPDDNSCLFRAAGLVLEHSGDGDVAKKLRRVVAEKVEQDPVQWCEPVLGSEPRAYVAKILGESTWGGAIELAILSEHYQTEICSIDVQTGRADRFGEQNDYPNRIILVYSGIHYDAVTLSPIDPAELPTGFPPEIGFDTTIFPSSDETVMSAAVVLVTELRQKHYYTDTATFDLRCEQCGQGLVGEKEARGHAEATGHTQFGEY